MTHFINGALLFFGTVLWDYLQPFPPFGAGYFRYVFVLYKQNREIDFGEREQRQPLPCNDLTARTFKTSEFYARHKADLVPSGLAFFQSDYDSGVREVCCCGLPFNLFYFIMGQFRLIYFPTLLI